jgi:hypothetical protein
MEIERGKRKITVKDEVLPVNFRHIVMAALNREAMEAW